MREKILFVIGTRPEIIKTAPVIQALRRGKKFRIGVCFSGQHRGLAGQMLKDFEIKPEFNLNLMKTDQSLNGLLARALVRLDRLYQSFAPSLVFIQGDTTTALAAALAAYYRRISLAHVEAGLRTFDLYRPYPEEGNRVLISRLADLNFAPTRTARRYLLREGIRPDSISVTGNPVIDSLHYLKRKGYEYLNSRLKELPRGKKIILVTAHRRENFGRPLRRICGALKELARLHPEVLIVYPVHLNPRVSAPVRKLLAGRPNILLLGPLHYRDLVRLIEESYLILTDSGGLQEEAPAFSRPVLVLREKTERPEGVEAGVARLVGTEKEKIVRETERLLNSPAAYRKMTGKGRRNLYGDGRAGERIARITEEFFSF